MQLLLTSEEFGLLQKILKEQQAQSCDERPSLEQVVSDSGSRDRLPVESNLLGKRLSRNLPLDFDELQSLTDCLNWYKRRLVAGLALSKGAAPNPKLQSELAALEHLSEKITEASAMI